jgi:cytochrome c-type biogenesis protein CcmH
MMRALFVAALLVLLHAVPALAVEPDEILKDPALEARARALSQQLRCMVCQNQSIDDSAAPLAHDLRVLVRDRLKNGDSDAQVIDFVVARYGEFVLLKPRFAWHNALLWAVPPGILVIGAVTLLILARRRRPSDAPPPLDDDEQRKLAAMLPPQDR